MVKAMRFPVVSEAEMRYVIKDVDPRFATDEYLDSLSHDELREYYQSCLSVFEPSSDDWCWRLDCVRTNNM